MSAKVLLVDDDVELIEMLRDYLQRDGFAVDAVHDGTTAVTAALCGDYAIAVLDVMMPGMGGIEVLRQIRAKSVMPVLMLTALGDDAERIDGLELGADDYVPKPCTPRELAARIRAILRRTAGAEPSTEADSAPTVVSVGDLVLWPEQRRAAWAEQPLDLTCTEFNLLEVLARHAGHAVSKDQLSQQGLGRALSRFDRSIDVHVSSIRHKLAPLADGRSRIQTVFRKGYQLVRE
ncbi:MAG: two component transcriptional regulator, winged helix family [Proteobacteria bacterium]|nr:two component transcriptional regulator, winged helix family [Pseudomonadota bacterium]